MKLTCKIIPVEQGTPEWRDVRSKLFTASEVGLFLTTDKPTKAQVEARIGLIEEKCEAFTVEGKLILEDENERIGRNFDVKRGNELEPQARGIYEGLTGNNVTQIGFMAHESCRFNEAGIPVSGFGCSPDGMIGGDEEWSHGVEIKCGRPKTVMKWIREGVLPDKHASQVHMSMAVTGLRSWDFFAYCPQVPPFLIRVDWDETTDRMLASLTKLHADFLKYRANLGAMKPVILNFPQPA